METPLTPLEFARRARRLYPDARPSSTARCASPTSSSSSAATAGPRRCSASASRQGDRVAYIAPNTPRAARVVLRRAADRRGAGADQLPADRRRLRLHHQPQRRARRLRARRLPGGGRQHPRASCRASSTSSRSKAARDGWLDYEALLGGGVGDVRRGRRSTRRDLLTINYTSGTTSRPKGVMITHRNAYMNVVGTLVHHPDDAAPTAICGRCRCSTPTAGRSPGPSPPSAARTSACRKVDPRRVFELIARRAHHDAVRRADGAHRARQRAGGAAARRAARRPRRSPPARRPPRPRSSGSRTISAGTLTQVYGLTETAPFITICEPRPEHDAALARRSRGDQGAAGRGAHHLGRAAGRRRRGTRGAARRPDARRDRRPRQRRDGGLLQRSRTRPPRRMRGGWFHSGDAAVVHPDGYVEIRDRFKDVIISGGENISSVEVEGALLRHPAVQEVAVVGVPHEQVGRSAARLRRAASPAPPRPRTSCASSRATASRTSRCRAGSPSSTSCPRPPPARFRSTSCAAAGAAISAQ